jgi:hypothetical protein
VGFELFQRHNKGCGKGFLLPVSGLDKLNTRSLHGSMRGYDLFHPHKLEVVNQMMKDPTSRLYREEISSCDDRSTLTQQKEIFDRLNAITTNIAELWRNESELCLHSFLFLLSHFRTCCLRVMLT